MGTVDEFAAALLRTSCGGDVDAVMPKLNTHGAAIVDDIVAGTVLDSACALLLPSLEAIAYRLEENDERLSDYDLDDLGLVRAPSVGDGKTNVHFSDETEEYEALEALAEGGRFASVASTYLGGGTASLFDCGASITRAGGEGMAWHRDGAEGEVTVLMSLEDVSAQQGCVGVIPGSHTSASLAKGSETREDDDVDEEAEAEAEWFAYRAGKPLFIDARTLHMAKDNAADEGRCILWSIFQRENDDDDGSEG